MEKWLPDHNSIQNENDTLFHAVDSNVLVNGKRCDMEPDNYAEGHDYP